MEEEVAVVEDDEFMVLEIPKLRHEMSLVYAFIGDRERVGVPLRYRLKYDKVIEELEERLGLMMFEVLVSDKSD